MLNVNLFECSNVEGSDLSGLVKTDDGVIIACFGKRCCPVAPFVLPIGVPFVYLIKTTPYTVNEFPR